MLQSVTQKSRIDDPIWRVSLQAIDFVDEKMPASKPMPNPQEFKNEPDGSLKIQNMQARDKLLKVIAAEISTARERAGLSVAELHRRTGISRTVLQGYEAARFAPGTFELKKVCEVLGVTPNRILFGDEKPLQVKPLLETLIGDINLPLNAVRLATVFQTLTTQERSAVFALIESIATPRIGGTEQLKMAMEAFDLMFSDGAIDHKKLRQQAEEVVANLSDEVKDKMQILDEKSKSIRPTDSK